MSTVAATPTMSSPACARPGTMGESTRFAGEERFVRWLCRLSPCLAVVVIPLASLYLVPVLYLKPLPTFQLGTSVWTWKPAWVLAVATGLLPWIWLACLRWERSISQQRRTAVPLAALLAVATVAGAGGMLDVPRVRWQLAELVKLRTPNPSFARNTLNWEAREFESVPASTSPAQRIGLVGSSQVYQGLDSNALATADSQWSIEKACLAGFGPLQYPWLSSRIAERHCERIVCCLSEFDFFREDEVPANRLRWAATADGCYQLWATLSPTERWTNRGHLADLAFAAVSPWWRWRDHLRRTAVGYWWNLSHPPVESESSGPTLAEATALSDGIQHLATNVRRARLVDANFRSFARYARSLRQSGVELIVLEGSCHPRGMAAYDSSFRTETRARLQQLSAEMEFRYVPADDLPPLSADDFADAYHLNRQGRARLTTALSVILQDAPRNP